MDPSNLEQNDLVNNPKRVCTKNKTVSPSLKHQRKNKTAKKSTKTTSSITGNRYITSQKGNQKSKQTPKSGNFPSLPNSQTDRGLSHGAKPKESKQIYSKLHIQNGKSGQHSSTSQIKRLGGIHRLNRRLPTCPHSSLGSTPARICCGKQILSVPSSTIRLDVSPSHIYTHSTGDCGTSTRKRHQNICISRRLATYRGFRKQAPSAHRRHNKHCDKFGVPNKLRKVSFDPNATPRVPRRQAKPPTTGCATTPTQGTQSKTGWEFHSQQAKDNSPTLVTISGPSGKPYRHRPRVQTEDEDTTNRILRPVSPSQRPSNQAHQSHTANETSTIHVARPSSPVDREAICVDYTNSYNVHRRINAGLGRSVRFRKSPRIMGRKRKSPTYQCSGDARNTICPVQIQGQSAGSDGVGEVRQPDCSFIHKQRRWHKVKKLVLSDIGDTRVVQHNQHENYGVVYPGKGQLRCGFPLPGELSAIRVATGSSDCQTNIQQVRETTSGPVRIDTKQAATQILHETQRPSSNVDGRTLDIMEEHSRICLSSICDDHQSIAESSKGRGDPSISGSLVAQAAMVLNTSKSSHSTSSDSPDQGRSPSTTGDEDLSPQIVQPKADIMDHFRTIASQAGLSSRAAELSANFLRSSTRSTYDSRLQYYFKWCSDNQVDPSSATIGKIADFLIHLFDKNRAISTIRGYRSAISAIHDGNLQDGETVSSSKHLTRLVKSLFLSRPPQKKLSPSWSLSKVLRSLTKAPFEPMHSSSLMNLTIKTAFLLAVASGRRRSLLHALTISSGHIRWETNGVRMIPHAKFVAKNQTVTSSLGEVFIPSLKTLSSVEQDKLWCPVRALKWYMYKTKTLRSSNQLFVSVHAPHGAVSPDTISRWIVEAIKSGEKSITSSRIRAHDTRGVASSWALFQGIPLEDILKAAYWHNPNTFTSCYLSDVLTNEAAFASAVLSCPNRK